MSICESHKTEFKDENLKSVEGLTVEENGWIRNLDEDVEEKGETSEGRNVKAKKIDRHQINGHDPYRSWCRHCVMGMGKDDAHRRIGERDEQEVTVVSMDYCYLHEDQKERKLRKAEEKEGGVREIDEMPVLMLVDRKSKMIMGEIVPRKGIDKFALGRGRKMIDGLGYDEMILKSDQEPSIVALRRGIKEGLRGKIMEEESAVGEHQALP
jgi:hypothetical protein